jgi:hypothetical protein
MTRKARRDNARRRHSADIVEFERSSPAPDAVALIIEALLDCEGALLTHQRTARAEQADRQTDNAA